MYDVLFMYLYMYDSKVLSILKKTFKLFMFFGCSLDSKDIQNTSKRHPNDIQNTSKRHPKHIQETSKRHPQHIHKTSKRHPKTHPKDIQKMETLERSLYKIEK